MASFRRPAPSPAGRGISRFNPPSSSMPARPRARPAGVGVLGRDVPSLLLLDNHRAVGADLSREKLMAEATKEPDVKDEFLKFGRERFSSGMYSLHWENLKGISLKLNGESSTLDVLYSKFAHSKITDEPEIPGLRYAKYVTDAGDLEIEADWTILATVGTLAGLFKRGINPVNVMWFYYDKDWSKDGDQSHTFFAVHDKKIVSERCHFSSEEPLILIQKKDDDPIWHSHPEFDEAVVRY